MRLGISELQASVERYRAEQRVVHAHHAEAQRVVQRIRRRLVKAEALDALDALDRLSDDEQYVLAQRELADR